MQFLAIAVLMSMMSRTCSTSSVPTHKADDLPNVTAYRRHRDLGELAEPPLALDTLQVLNGLYREAARYNPNARSAPSPRQREAAQMRKDTSESEPTTTGTEGSLTSALPRRKPGRKNAMFDEISEPSSAPVQEQDAPYPDLFYPWRGLDNDRENLHSLDTKFHSLAPMPSAHWKDDLNKKPTGKLLRTLLFCECKTPTAKKQGEDVWTTRPAEDRKVWYRRAPAWITAKDEWGNATIMFAFNGVIERIKNVPERLLPLRPEDAHYAFVKEA